MSDLAYLASTQCLSATAGGSSFISGLLPSLFSVSFLIFSFIVLSEHYLEEGLSNSQNAEKNINRLSTFASSSSGAGAKGCTLHAAG